MVDFREIPRRDSVFEYRGLIQRIKGFRPLCCILCGTENQNLLRGDPRHSLGRRDLVVLLGPVVEEIKPWMVHADGEEKVVVEEIFRVLCLERFDLVLCSPGVEQVFVCGRKVLFQKGYVLVFGDEAGGAGGEQAGEAYAQASGSFDIIPEQR